MGSSTRERSLAFYQGVLGLALHSSDAFGDFIALEGALLRLTVIADHTPSPHPVLGWEVADIAGKARALLERGVPLTRFPGMEHDDLGVWTSPDGRSKVGFFSDPDGNVLMLTQR